MHGLNFIINNRFLCFYLTILILFGSIHWNKDFTSIFGNLLINSTNVGRNLPWIPIIGQLTGTPCVERTYIQREKSGYTILI